MNLPLAAIAVSGGNLTGRWTKRLAAGSEAMVQAYIDHTERTVPPTFAEKLDIVDLQFQHSLEVAKTHSIVWGAQYRHSWDRVTNSTYFAFRKPKADSDKDKEAHVMPLVGPGFAGVGGTF